LRCKDAGPIPRSHKPDLLLLDLGLPDTDGLTVIRQVRAWSPVPIVVLSARTMEDQKIAIDLARRLTQGPQGNIHLTPLEYRVLECLARQTGMVVRQRQLLREVWGPDRQDDARSLRVCIKYLRDKLEPDPRRPHFLVTETGLGYRLCTDEVLQANKPADEGGGTETVG
jgi:two-component system KDP operon response regulator KdpE